MVLLGISFTVSHYVQSYWGHSAHETYNGAQDLSYLFHYNFISSYLYY